MMRGPTISAAVFGAVVALPNSQILPAGITVNRTNDTFTVAPAGRYRLSYHINTALSLLLGSRLMLNGSAKTASTILPSLCP